MERRLLILTQKIDKEDPILGFFHNWVKHLASSAPFITVICLELGDYDLPANVKVLSLGKEAGKGSKLKYALRFYKHAWLERTNYDVVFVHMNQEYVLLGGLMWKMLGKKIAMWRNHRHGNFLTRIAGALSKRVYSTSPHSFTARWGKTKLMPAGIDTDAFRPAIDSKRIENSILFAARISPVKRPDLLLKAADALWTEGVNFRLSIVGDAPKGQEEYYADLRKAAAILEMENVAAFYDGVSQDHMPELFGSHEVFVNLTETGSFDKTVLEAMACECLPVISNISFRSLLPTEYREFLFFKEGDVQDLEAKLRETLALPQSKRVAVGAEMREIVVEKHSLDRLVRELLSDLQAI
jgi:glycosyltransferase involved in cell wall biosynthesis